ncbi:MAG: tyrosine-type recombinase/integrase, partial [bacterium]
MLNARDEKNRRGSEIPLRTDLAADIRSWLADRLAWAQTAARDAEEPIPAALPSDEPLFVVPDGLIRIFDRDLVFAGLARVESRDGKEVVIKTDDRGRTIDIHALRHTFGTHLSKAGVPLRTAQAAMRHSDPSLTANVYTDPKLLDVAEAVASLPDLPLAAVGEPAVAIVDRRSAASSPPHLAHPLALALGHVLAHASVRPGHSLSSSGCWSRAGRLTHNPLLAVAVADQRADTRRQRRALTEEELARLLDAAQRRP